MKKKALLDLHVLDLIIENKSKDVERIKNYNHDLLIFGQREIYQIYYIENDLITCKNQEIIKNLLFENNVEKLEYTQLEISNPIYSSLIEISKYASKLNVTKTEDIKILSDFEPFKMDKFTTIEILFLMINYDIEYLLTLNPYIKLDFLYLKEMINNLSRLKDLKVRFH